MATHLVKILSGLGRIKVPDPARTPLSVKEIKKSRNSETLATPHKIKKFETLGAEWYFLNSGEGCTPLAGLVY